MSDNYKYDIPAIQESADTMHSIVSNLQGILVKAQSLKKQIEGYNGWKGQQKKELIAFLDLLIPYHKDLIHKSGNPFVQYMEAMNKLEQDLNDYSATSKSYKELKRQ